MKEDETIKFTISDEQTQSQITISDIEYHLICIHNPEGKVANIDFEDGKVVYSGDLEVDESAKIFFDSLLKEHLEWKAQFEEREKMEKCPDCKQMTVKTKWSGVECTDPNCNYWYCL